MLSDSFGASGYFLSPTTIPALPGFGTSDEFLAARARRVFASKGHVAGVGMFGFVGHGLAFGRGVSAVVCPYDIGILVAVHP